MKSKVDELVNQWIEGDLEPEDAETLRGLLAEDASAREACYELMLLDQLLASREEAQGANPLEPVLPFPPRKFSAPRAAMAAVAGLAALIVAGFWFAGRPDGKEVPLTAGPPITASSDSRITIAQREDRSQWKPGELLRLERGTAAIQLGQGVLAHFEGPAAIELANPEGDIRLFEGRGSFQVDPGGRRFAIETPGGIIRGTGNQFVCLISPDQGTQVEINSGDVEITSHSGHGPFTIHAGEAVRLEVSGAVTPTARPGIPFRVGLPEELALFSDDFDTADGTELSKHAPELGQKWEILEESNPTVIRKKRLDTSSGSRRLLARLAAHDPGSTGSVYVFSFSMVPPAWSHDKVSRMDGIESIAIVDPEGRELFNVVAEAVNTHRWQLKGGGQASPLTPVCALWDHRLTICYGLDGRVTLHDGASAQAPIIASLWIKNPSAVGGVLISNRTGGDLAFRRISTSLLRAPMMRNE
jgi:hypothetical protein